jgi:hypothetical protein
VEECGEEECGEEEYWVAGKASVGLKGFVGLWERGRPPRLKMLEDMRKKTLDGLESLMARLSQEWAGRDHDCGRNKFTLNYCAGNPSGHQNDWESVLSMLRTRNSKIEIRERKDGYQAGGNILPREACKGVCGGKIYGALAPGRHGALRGA